MHLKSITFFLLLFASTNLSAQLEKTLHQTFDIVQFKSLSIDLIGDSVQVVSWAGNTILTETKIKLYDASPSIMAHFTEKAKRYEIAADPNNSELHLKSTDTERKPIRTKNGECYEQVKIRVFVPDAFEQDGDLFVRSK